MRQITITFTIIAMVVLSAATLLTVSSCTKDASGASGNDISLEKSEDLSIARVGTTDLTLAELFKIPQLYQLIDERLIGNEILRQEVLKRGLTIDMDEVQKEIDNLVMMNGGMEQFLNNMNPAMPKALLPDDIHSYFVSNAMQKAIVEDEYDKTVGVPTEDTIDEEWDSNMDYWRNVYANENEVDDITTVTKDMAHAIIVRELKVRWVSENTGMIIAGLRDQYDVDFILRNMVDSSSEVEVPLVSGGGETETPEPELIVPGLENTEETSEQEGEAGSEAGTPAGH
jgi:hypothetical protein